MQQALGLPGQGGDPPGPSTPGAIPGLPRWLQPWGLVLPARPQSCRPRAEQSLPAQPPRAMLQAPEQGG